MVRDPGDDFLDLAEQHYPGSRQVRRTVQQQRDQPVHDEEPWDSESYWYRVGGKQVEFFRIGALAKALNREPPTIRMWENDGTIPPAAFSKGTGRGKRRLYTRGQVEGLRAIASEEGILEPAQSPNGRRAYFLPIKDTQFKRRAYELWVRLAQAEGAQ